MPNIPSAQDLASDPLTHRFGDFFNPPGLTNFLGCVQSEIDLTAVRNLNFPPFATGPALTAAFVLDGRHFQALGIPVTTIWQPDKIVRSAASRGFRLESTTVLVPDTQAVLILTSIVNTGPSDEIDVGYNFANRVGRSDRWDGWLPDVSEKTDVETHDALIVTRSSDGRATCASAVAPKPEATRRNTFRYHVRLEPGERWQAALCLCLDEERDKAVASARTIAASAETQIESVEQFWSDELQSIFTPGNDRYSGSLPILETADEEIRKLYWMGAAGLAYFKRDSPHSAIGRSYDTLMPRYWLTLQCIWDYYLSSPAHVLLDPEVMRASLERWMATDLHQHFGTEYLTGSTLGPWYTVNDSAMASMIHRHATWTGASDWLSREVDGRTVLDHARGYAEAWRGLQTDSGLAGFGDEFNLLECVGSYVHEVASLNAASVAALRQTAALIEHAGSVRVADQLRAEATALSRSLIDLYIEDGGYWNARLPDGATRAVRHAFDLMTVLNSIPEDLTASQRADMVDFFVRELKTDTWMRALSAADDDVLFSVRPDHQWTGAYAAWPSETAKGLCRIGRSDLARDWMRGLARSANQGPFAQAHMADGVVPLESGGARKSTYEHPYINDWHSASSGSWVSAVIEGLFGVSADFAGPTASPVVEPFDRDARLTGLRIQGNLYTVDRTGIHPE